MDATLLSKKVALGCDAVTTHRVFLINIPVPSVILYEKNYDSKK